MSKKSDGKLYDVAQQAAEAKPSIIAEPIINRPYDEPQYFWETVDWETHIQKPPEKKEGRRPAGYFFNNKGQKSQGSLFDEDFIELHCVNMIRERVREWRNDGYRGVTPVTRRLLEHWNSGLREPRLFYCQREAIEALIWLTEAHPSDRQGLVTDTVDGERVSLEKAHVEFLRYCCKMATGTGKTVCMAMVIAWQTLNKAQYAQDTRYTNAFLLVAPGLTVKNRLEVLRPESDGNYYDKFGVVPAELKANLSYARVCILHRQEMAIQDDAKQRGIVKLGEESDTAFANRLLKRSLGSANRVLVLNDEGHHCYRPRPKVTEEKEDKPTTEEKADIEHAAQWLTGLEKINRARNIQVCVDFSATPFYIHGSGYPVGRPFPWIISDFGLLDALESGLVKIPVMPVDDSKSSANSPPAYFHLWRWVNDQLATSDRYGQRGRGKGNPVKIAETAEAAAITLTGNYKTVLDKWTEGGSAIPPCMIVVCQDTDISGEMFKLLTKENDFFSVFSNRNDREVSYLYDSKALKDISKLEEGEKAADRELRLRDILNTVGKQGQAGEQVRLVCSVSMLTEGWDAQNVTQILGLRAFTSQLLCEQVVGRALRRMSYDVNPETGMLEEETAEIFGVPFQVIPVKPGQGTPPPPPSQLVRALPERKEEFEITFPRVEGYVNEFQEKVVCDWETVPILKAESGADPLVVDLGSLSGVLAGKPQGFGIIDKADRVPYYTVTRMTPILYQIAARITEMRVSGNDPQAAAKRARLFPQIRDMVQTFFAERINLGKVPAQELTLAVWQQKIASALEPHIHSESETGEPLILPRIERYRPTGSTKDVMFRTGRPVVPTQKSHISHVVVDSPVWEKVATRVLELHASVQSYARNDHLEFLLPFVDEKGINSNHYPDFIVRLANGLHIALEIKGHVREEDRLKEAAGKKWAKAVNRYYGERKWAYHVCYDPDSLGAELDTFSGGVTVPDRPATAAPEPPTATSISTVDLIAGGESATVEFKQSLEYVDPKSEKLKSVPADKVNEVISKTQKDVVYSALKTICALINANGGTLLIGMHDNGSIVGIEPDYTLIGKRPDKDGFENKLWDMLKTRIHPIPSDEAHITFEVIDGKAICRVDVSKSLSPHYLDKELFVRLGNSTEKLSGPEMQDWLDKRRRPGGL